MSERKEALAVEPELGRLYVVDEDDDGNDVLNVFAVGEADYCLYQRDGRHWLTLHLRTGGMVEPADGDDPEPWLEVNLPFDRDPAALLERGRVFDVLSYDEELFNLTGVYHWSHRSFDGTMLVEEFRERRLTARLEGMIEGADPLCVRAVFRLEPDRRRGFD